MVMAETKSLKENTEFRELLSVVFAISGQRRRDRDLPVVTPYSDSWDYEVCPEKKGNEGAVILCIHRVRTP